MTRSHRLRKGLNNSLCKIYPLYLAQRSYQNIGQMSSPIVFDKTLSSWQNSKSTSSEPQTLIYGWGEFHVGMTDLIVKSGVKEALVDHPVSADFYEALNDEVAELLTDAVEPRDL